MPALLGIVAGLEIVLGLLVVIGAGSVIHQIAGILGIGFGFLTAGIAGIVAELVRIRKAAERPQAIQRRDERIEQGLEW